MKMQYIGPDIFTIKTGTIYELAKIHRVKSDNNFPSGISLGFKTSTGFFGMSDRYHWIKVYNKSNLK